MSNYDLHTSACGYKIIISIAFYETGKINYIVVNSYRKKLYHCGPPHEGIISIKHTQNNKMIYW